MDKLAKFRGIIQGVATLLTNIHLPNFLDGSISRNNGKKICVPGLNCYSCPAATGACPIGSIQAVVGSPKFKFSYYCIGILILFGTVFGRFICGFLCPFGWFQDLIYKIPSKKFSTKKLWFLTYVKYLMLIVVLAFPVLFTNELGMGSPFFCKYVCPQGILEGGIPLAIAKSGIREALGVLFMSKLTILISVVVLSLVFFRPFCKWICPLGAFYSLFNKISIYNFGFEKEKCVGCKKCVKKCKMDVDIRETTCSRECIRCGECAEVCPTGAIKSGFKIGSKEKCYRKNSLGNNRGMIKEMKKKITTLSLALLMSFGVFTGCSKNGSGTNQENSEQKTSTSTSANTTKKFPNFEATDLSGKKFDQSEFSKNAVTVVNFWFTGCKACVEEMEDLEKFSAELKKKNSSLISVNTEIVDENTKNEAKKVADSKKITFPVLQAKQGGEYEKYVSNIFAFPTTVLVNRNGEIVGDPIEGAINTPETMKLINQRIDEIIAKDKEK